MASRSSYYTSSSNYVDYSSYDDYGSSYYDSYEGYDDYSYYGSDYESEFGYSSSVEVTSGPATDYSSSSGDEWWIILLNIVVGIACCCGCYVKFCGGDPKGIMKGVAMCFGVIFLGIGGCIAGAFALVVGVCGTSCAAIIEAFKAPPDEVRIV